MNCKNCVFWGTIEGSGYGYCLCPETIEGIQGINCQGESEDEFDFETGELFGCIHFRIRIRKNKE